MFGRNSINGSVEWLGIPDFLRNDGPPWILNLLAPYASWGDIGPSTNPKWGSGSGGHYDRVFLCGIFPSASFQFTTGGSLKTRAALRAAPVIISIERTVRTTCKVPPLATTPSAVLCLTCGMTTGVIFGMSRLINSLRGNFTLVVSVLVTFPPFVTSVSSYHLIAFWIAFGVIFV